MEKRVKWYVGLSYFVFWFMVLGLCGTASMVFHCPPVVMRILSNICAWAPTIVLLIGFKYFCPDRSIADFYKKAFGGKINIVMLIVAAIITLGATIVTVLILSLFQGKAFGEYWNLFMEKNDNLIYGIVIHFCFNFLYCFLQVDIWFYVVLSAIYIVIIALICWKKNVMSKE